MTEGLKQLKNLKVRVQKLNGIPGLFLREEDISMMERLISSEIARRQNAGRKKLSKQSRSEQLRTAQIRFRSKHIHKGGKELREENNASDSNRSRPKSSEKHQTRKSNHRVKKNPNNSRHR